MALSPSAATAQSSKRKGQGVGRTRESTGRHFLWWQEASVEGMRSSGDRLSPAHPFPAPRGRLWVAVTLSWLGGVPGRAVGDPHMFAGL